MMNAQMFQAVIVNDKCSDECSDECSDTSNCYFVACRQYKDNLYRAKLNVLPLPHVKSKLIKSGVI